MGRRKQALRKLEHQAHRLCLDLGWGGQEMEAGGRAPPQAGAEHLGQLVYCNWDTLPIIPGVPLSLALLCPPAAL